MINSWIKKFPFIFCEKNFARKGNKFAHSIFAIIKLHPKKMFFHPPRDINHKNKNNNKYVHICTPLSPPRDTNSNMLFPCFVQKGLHKVSPSIELLNVIYDLGGQTRRFTFHNICYKFPFSYALNFQSWT